MPDIAMCMREDCPIKTKCYRFMAEPSFYQTFFKPDKIGKECEYFMKLWKKENKNQERGKDE